MKRAFTLAEILITLAIIGVVAALTMPTLMADVQKRRFESAFAKAMNTLENNNRILLAEEGAGKLSDICGEKYLPDCLGRETVLSYNSETGYYITKDGIGFMQLGTGVDSNPAKLMSGRYYEVIIDVNGVTKPNTLGQDQYKVHIDYNGSVEDVSACNEEYEYNSVGYGASSNSGNAITNTNTNTNTNINSNESTTESGSWWMVSMTTTAWRHICTGQVHGVWDKNNNTCSINGVVIDLYKTRK